MTSATSTRSMKRIESSQSTSAGPAPGSVVIHVVVAVVDEVQRVLDVALGRQDERLARLCAAPRPSQVLGRQRVQPASAGPAR